MATRRQFGGPLTTHRDKVYSVAFSPTARSWLAAAPGLHQATSCQLLDRRPGPGPGEDLPASLTALEDAIIAVNRSYLLAAQPRAVDRYHGQNIAGPAGITSEVTNLVLQGRNIQAIKLYRKQNPGTCLKQAKGIIDQIG